MKRTNRTNAKNLTRAVLLLLLFSLALPIMTGCMGVLPLATEKQDLKTEDEDMEPSNTYTVNAEQENNIPPAKQNSLASADEQKQKFLSEFTEAVNKAENKSDNITAEPIAAAGYLSAWFELNFTIKNGQIYEGNTLYETVTYSENFEVIYSDALMPSAGCDDIGTVELLEKIKNHKGCYLLETNDKNFQGIPKYDKIAVYYIDDIYYFLTFTKDTVIRVHSNNINK